MKRVHPRIRAIDIFLLVTIGLAVALWLQTSSIKPPFNIYPKMIILLVGLLSTICLIQNMYAITEGIDEPDKSNRFWPFLATVGGIFIYIIAIDFIGYFLSTLVYLCLFFFLKRLEIDGWEGINPKGIALDVGIASIVTAFVGLVFKVGLKLVFPEALLV